MYSNRAYKPTHKYALIEIIPMNLDSLGYDDWGIYYGKGRPLFDVFCTNPKINEQIRAPDLIALKNRLRRANPNYSITFVVIGKINSPNNP